MKAIILGAGQVGFSIARYLVQEQNHITVVDHSPQVLELISDKLDIQPVLGFASHPDVLDRAGAKEADLIIAVTSSDEVNMIACEVAKCLFDVPMKIARVRHQNYLRSAWSEMLASQQLTIDVIISPEVEVAQTINRNLRVPGAFDVISLIDESLKLIGVRCLSHSGIINTPIKHINSLYPHLDLVIVLIKRDEQIIFPSSRDHLLVDDEVYVITLQEQLNGVMEAFGYSTSESREILVVGGGNIGLNLAVGLEKDYKNVHARIIEKDAARCEQIARFLKRTEILQGDALDYDLLQEANIENCETVIAVSNDDKVNILASLISKRHGAKRSLALLNNMQYASMVTSLGADAVISPKALTVSTILKHVREGNLQSIHPIAEGNVVLIEARAKETSHIIGLDIEDVTIMSEIMVVVLMRGEDLHFLPTRMNISANDRLTYCNSKRVST
ncbi:MAG: Trk system potassium transporter TrkA [Pseudomonadota bacterium]|nr:Trk system potassium transporter TrkA [Alphaproteobacteria bacterium]